VAVGGGHRSSPRAASADTDLVADTGERVIMRFKSQRAEARHRWSTRTVREILAFLTIGGDEGHAAARYRL
jgi:hypothetical protein